MAYTLPRLLYDYGSLEPHIDAKTMEIHYTKHHQAYVDNLNKALEQAPQFQNKPIEDLIKSLDSLPESIRTAVRNNGGGHLNHSMFWLMMSRNGGFVPNGAGITAAINQRYGSFAVFQEQFNAAAKTVFGSGWAWLVLGKDGKLSIMTTSNQDAPISQGHAPLLGLDVWEHAYYLKYQNRRPDYISAWWNVVNWEYVEDQYRLLAGKV